MSKKTFHPTQFILKKVFFTVFSLAVAAGFLHPAVAAEKYEKPVNADSRYRGAYVRQSVPDPIQIVAGESKKVTVQFKNTGTATWAAKGNAFVSVYTIAPQYHDSLFASKSWLNQSQPAKITASTKPGAIASVTFELTAPITPGEYTEYFSLAAEDTTWIKGASFYFKIKVLPTKKIVTTPVSAAVSFLSATSSAELATSSENGLSAKLVTASDKMIEAAGGVQIPLSLEFINNGSVSWSGYAWREVLSRSIATSSMAMPVVLQDTSWLTGTTILAGETPTQPGAALPIVFTFRTPTHVGKYLARFELAVNGQRVPGGLFEIPVTVTETVPDNYVSPAFAPARPLLSPPAIRVGLYAPQKPVLFTAATDYRVFNGAVEEGVLSANTAAEINYKNGVYFFTSETFEFESKQRIRLVPDDVMATFTLTNYDRRIAGRKDVFNTYRGIFELVYAPTSKMPYVVNELPLDAYVAGVAEVSNGSPSEYILAMAVAERSYAYYHMRYAAAGGKVFDVVPTTADQLYLGYKAELAAPNVAAAAYATRGQLVTHKGSPVVTPYFSHSDGRTRSWSEVWGGGAKPWLVSVVALYDKGKNMLGHGVGLSGLDASWRAAKDGWKYDEILKYYYSGTEVERIY